MTRVFEKRQTIWSALCVLAGFLVVAMGSITSQANHTATGLMLICFAVVLYFVEVLFVADRNWLDIRAVFSAIWIFTIGCAALRWAEYQKPWENKTWVLLAVAYAMFFVGATLGIAKGAALSDYLASKISRFKVGRVRIEMQSNRLFAVCLIATLLGFLCFAINVAIRGFIPAFSDRENAYIAFYTKFHIFAVAATGVSGLCYYCIKTQPLKRVQKVILWLCIFYLVILFPILVISRGTFITAAVSLMVSVFYLNRKKFISVVICVALILGIYMFTSSLRGYTNNQLKLYFEPVSLAETTPTQTEAVAETTAPAQTEAVPETTVPTATEMVPETTVPAETEMVPETTAPAQTEAVPETAAPAETQAMQETQLPMETQQAAESVEPTETLPHWSTDYDQDATALDVLRLRTAFVYSYLTVSHDNFNEGVANVEYFTHGTKQFAPFNVILRSQWVDENNSKSPFFKVKKELNTINLVGDFYYDFGSWGVAICTLLWAFVFGLMQAMYEKGKNGFVLQILGNAMVPVALCFFSNWLSIFSQWMLWGVILLAAIATCVVIEPKGIAKQQSIE